jgi:8-oxo-dGTP pyrophosphatase MutT (NUDIX family)
MKHYQSAGCLIKSGDKYLIAHSTDLGKTEFNRYDRRWTIPKGIVDEGENKYEAAIREMFEETGIDLKTLGILPNEIPMGTITYKSCGYNKTVTIFLVNDIDGVIQSQVPVCNSLIDHSDRPEMDGFEWVLKDQAINLCFRSLSDFLNTI